MPENVKKINLDIKMIAACFSRMGKFRERIQIHMSLFKREWPDSFIMAGFTDAEQIQTLLCGN